MAEAFSGDVIVADFHDELWTERLPFIGLALIPTTGSLPASAR
jgi:hypothetical protein